MIDSGDQNEGKKPRLVAAIGFISNTKEDNNRHRGGHSRKRRGRNKESHSVWVTESEGPCAAAEILEPMYVPLSQCTSFVQRPDMESAASATTAPMEAAFNWAADSVLGPQLLLPERDPEKQHGTRSCPAAAARPMAPRPPPLPGASEWLGVDLNQQIHNQFITTPPQHQQEPSRNHSAGSQGSKSTSRRYTL